MNNKKIKIQFQNDKQPYHFEKQIKELGIEIDSIKIFIHAVVVEFKSDDDLNLLLLLGIIKRKVIDEYREEYTCVAN